jgi:hypothetical protein
VPKDSKPGDSTSIHGCGANNKPDKNTEPSADTAAIPELPALVVSGAPGGGGGADETDNAAPAPRYRGDAATEGKADSGPNGSANHNDAPDDNDGQQPADDTKDPTSVGTLAARRRRPPSLKRRVLNHLLFLDLSSDRVHSRLLSALVLVLVLAVVSVLILSDVLRDPRFKGLSDVRDLVSSNDPVRIASVGTPLDPPPQFRLRNDVGFGVTNVTMARVLATSTPDVDNLEGIDCRPAAALGSTLNKIRSGAHCVPRITGTASRASADLGVVTFANMSVDAAVPGRYTVGFFDAGGKVSSELELTVASDVALVDLAPASNKTSRLRWRKRRHRRHRRLRRSSSSSSSNNNNNNNNNNIRNVGRTRSGIVRSRRRLERLKQLGRSSLAADASVAITRQTTATTAATVLPTTAEIGKAVTPVVRIRVRDTSGRPLAGRTVVAYTWRKDLAERDTVWAADPVFDKHAVLEGATAVTGTDGVAVFDKLTFVAANHKNQFLHFRCDGLVISPAASRPTVLSTSVAKVDILRMPSVKTLEGFALKQQPQLKVLDAAGRPVAGKRAYARMVADGDGPIAPYYVRNFIDDITKELINPISGVSDSNGVITFEK